MTRSKLDVLQRAWWTFCLFGSVFLVDSLTTSQSARPIKRIGIIGSGIGGLAAAHALSPLYDDISLFDARPTLDKQAGAGVQLSGGLAVLGRINKDLQQAVQQAGQPVAGIQSRAKAWGRGESTSKLLQLDLKDVVAKDTVARETLLDGGNLSWITIMRGTLQEVLFERLPAKCRQQASFGKTVIDIQPDRESGGAVCVFSDGSVAGPFDLLVGADGIKSRCKEYVCNGKITRKSSQREGSSVAIYSGIRIRYAVKDGNEVDATESAVLKQYFGDGAYALHGSYGNGKAEPRTKCAFLIYLDDDYIGPFRKGESKESLVNENADWAQDQLALDDAQRSMLLETMRCQVPAEDIKETIGAADRFFELGVYFHNPFSLAGWSRLVEGSQGAHVVLMGDAAHAIPPFLGQGANQALQDAVSLTNALREYETALAAGADGDVELRPLLKKYERVRWNACFQVFWKSIFLGYLETGGPNGVVAKFRDVFFRTMGLIGVASRVLLSSATPKV